jgi:hypothetical protein
VQLPLPLVARHHLLGGRHGGAWCGIEAVAGGRR